MSTMKSRSRFMPARSRAAFVVFGRGVIQTNLPPGWTGGDRLAIHGGSTGGAVSTGCLHADEADLRWLMRSVPLGAQITIHP